MNEIGIGDVIATKDGLTLRVLSVRKVDGNQILRLEGIDDTSESPIRTTVLPNNILRVLRKAVPPPKEVTK